MFFADGTEMINIDDDGRGGTIKLTISDNGIWECRHNYDDVNGVLLIKRPGWEKARKYTHIRFKENWGDFIEGKEYVEPKPSPPRWTYW